jgi:hypothetical protein
MSDLRYPAWEKPYLEAMLELDPQKLAHRVKAAELAILVRLQKLRTNSDGTLERQAIEGAQNGLLVLKKECARFPTTKNDATRPGATNEGAHPLPS